MIPPIGDVRERITIHVLFGSIDSPWTAKKYPESAITADASCYASKSWDHVDNEYILRYLDKRQVCESVNLIRRRK